MADLEKILERVISSVTGSDPVEMSDGTTAYTAILMQCSGRSLMISADPDTDQVVAEFQTRKTEIKDAHSVSGSGAMVGKRVDNIWLCRNSKGYKDILMFALNGFQPSIGFIGEASRISLMEIKPIIAPLVQNRDENN